MSITAASALIASKLQAGLIDSDTAQRAQVAIRASRYGNRMSGSARAQMLASRFGISA